MIVFEDSEIEFDCDNATGKLKIIIPIKTVMSKLPRKNPKIKYETGYESKEEVERDYFPRLSEVNFQMWLSLNFEQTKTQKRSLRVYGKILSDLLNLKKRYGACQLNDALLKCNTPEKCTINYLQAILKNNNKELKNVGQDKNYRKSITEAASRFL